ncbi:unnamed protein product [Urochloa humidicola]
MDCDSRSGGGRRLKDRLAQLLRPAANSLLLRSPCSSSSSTSATALTATAGATTTTTATISTSSTSTAAANYTTVTGALQLIPRAEPFSAALDRLRHPPPPPQRTRGSCNRDGMSFSSGHGSRRRRCHSMNAVDKGRGVFVAALSSNPYGFTSSGEDDDDTDAAADDGHRDDDTEAFLSSSRSRSLIMSSDSSSGFYTFSRNPPPPPAATDKSHRHRCKRRRRRCRRPSASCVAEACGAGAVREPAGFRPLVAAAAAEQVRRGLAVVKRSRDPYGDFRESMVEMIVGRQVFGAAELERLLASYLSLNAPRFHPVILQAFSDIWVVLHGG